jgi:hypothetical protein
VNPASVIPLVKAQMADIKDNVRRPYGTGDPIMLWEGKSAWEDAIKRLTYQENKAPLGWSDGLALTA